MSATKILSDGTAQSGTDEGAGALSVPARSTQYPT
jgi:hypothetical protein